MEELSNKILFRWKQNFDDDPKTTPINITKKEDNFGRYGISETFKSSTSISDIFRSKKNH